MSSAANLQYNKLQLRDIIRMYPVLCGLTDKVLLAASSSAIPFDWISSGSYQIVKFRELDNKSIVIVLEKRFRFQTCSKNGFQVPGGLFLGAISVNHAKDSAAGTHIVLLDDFLKSGIIQLREFCQVMHVGNDIAQVFFQQVEILLRWDVIFRICNLSI